jgi:hypothetical protein
MTPMFKAGLLATTMAAVGLVPAAGFVTLVSVDAAYAKGGGNGNGSGDGNGNGGQGSEARGGQKEAHGGGRPDWAGSRGNGGNGNGGGRSESARGESRAISNFIRGLTGEDKRAAREQARADARAARRAPTDYAPVASIQPGKRPARNPESMHPSQLGNMNGALNANINAVLAHIRNGNTNGPVGGLAALAVADAELAGAERVLEKAALAEALAGSPYKTVAEYNAAVMAGASRDTAIDEALAALDVLPGEPYALKPPSDAVVMAAEVDLAGLEAAQADAEASILSLWNKNTDATPETEDALLTDLRNRLDGHDAAIEQAITEAAARAVPEIDSENEAYLCAETDGCEAPETGGEEFVAID